MLVVGHRGACSYRPEHTAASYSLAVAQGADAIDVDLVCTADGVLVVRHDDELSSTTDVADHPELAHLRTTRTVDSVVTTGWFSEDLTLAQVRTLRARERLPRLRPASAAHDGEQGVLTFAEVLSLRAELSARAGRAIGVWPELKHPTHSAGLGLDLVPRVLDDLAAAGLDAAGAPVVVQCFEVTALVELHAERPHLALLQLVEPTGAPPDLRAAGDPRDFAELVTPAGLAEVAEHATLLGPHLVQVHPRSADGTASGRPSGLVDDAHAAGLRVVPYTLRAENTFLPAELRSGSDLAGHGDVREQARRLVAAGVDGLFADCPDVAVSALPGMRPGMRPGTGAGAGAG